MASETGEDSNITQQSSDQEGNSECNPKKTHKKSESNSSDNSVGSSADDIDIDLNNKCSGSSDGKSSGGKSPRFPASFGATTRKCVLTLDGYSYVIVASTPENRGAREDINLSDKRGSPSSDQQLQQQLNSKLTSPIQGPSVNGQVSTKPGSLTIVRRSSRKTILSSPLELQLKSPNQQQQSLPSSTLLSFSNEPKQEQSFEATTTSEQQKPEQPPEQSFSEVPTSTTALFPKDDPQILGTNRIDRSTEQYSRAMADLQTESPNDINQMERVTIDTGRISDTTVTTTSSSDTGADAYEPVDLYTDNLPAVDTPDACDKAAIRLRSLLRMLQRGEISAELLQKNLHYAARVLEAVFLDETKRPCKNDHESIKSGQNSIDKESTTIRCSSCNSCTKTTLDSNLIVAVSNKTSDNDSDATTIKPASSSVNTPSSDSSLLSNFHRNQLQSASDNLPQPPSTTMDNVDDDDRRSKSSEPTSKTTPTTTTTTTTAQLLQSTSSTKHCDNIVMSSSSSTTIVTTTATICSTSTSVAKKSSLKLLPRQRTLRTPIWARSESNNKTRLVDEDDELSEVQPDAVPPEVREWLASTFTRQQASSWKRSDEKPKFRSVAHAIRAGIFVDRIYRRVTSTALMQYPPEAVKVLKTADEWTFDVFALAESTSSQPIKYLCYYLFDRYSIIHKFKISPVVLETFLNKMEEGYCRYRNPYHNNLHAADVTQTMNYMLHQTGLVNWLTDLEIFATILAALIHDYEHTGTTNNFHVMSGSDTALLYNDKAVLENHHLSASFKVMKEDECNILSNLSKDDYRAFRSLVIDMVLSTDMSFHFSQLKNMKHWLTLPEPPIDKSKALSLVLHCCDISHPAKKWQVHHRWTMLLLEEFFRQGDLERELGLPFSPLCDRNNTLVAESQIGFIDFILHPSMSVCSDMLEYVLAPFASMYQNEEEEGAKDDKDKDAKKKPKFQKPWTYCLMENRKIWKEQAIKDAEQRALQSQQEEGKEENAEAQTAEQT